MDERSRPVVIELMFPRRFVAVPMSKSGGLPSAASFEPGYAITCHKFQGSQVPIIISVLDDSAAANWTTSREWHYTACSRTERMLLTIGKWETLMRQCRRVSLTHRKTFLVEEFGSAKPRMRVEE